MSLDYPFYEELKRRRHPAAKWWRLGDVRYYLGLLPAMLMAIPAVISLICLSITQSRSQLLIIFFFVAATIVFVVGALLKRRAWTIAAKDGIDVSAY